jgi:major membrane immunogen (membrane-anchored lipoprotein)
MFKLMLIFMSLFALVGCRNDEVVIDETLPVVNHFAIEEGIDEDGWKNYITITVNSDDVVTDVQLNAVARLANTTRRELARLDQYEDVFGYNFYEQVSFLENSLVGISSGELADAIRDAYSDNLVDFDTTTFAELALRAVPVERGSYIDGTYHSINVADEAGLQYFVNLFVIHGNIVAVHFNAMTPEGVLLYNHFMSTTVDHEIVAWRNQIQLLEEALIQLQDPFVFTFDENGFTTDIPGLDIEIESFVSLVIQALTEGPVNIEMEE